MSPARSAPAPAVQRVTAPPSRPRNRRAGSGSGSANGWVVWMVTVRPGRPGHDELPLGAVRAGGEPRRAAEVGDPAADRLADAEPAVARPPPRAGPRGCRAPRRAPRSRPGPASPRAAPRPGRPGRRAAPRCRGRPRPRRPARPPRPPAARPAPGGDHVDAGPGLEVDQGGGQVGAAGRRRADLVLLADQGPQRRLLLAGQPAELGRLAAELGAPALHQASTCSTPSCTARASRARSAAAAAVALGPVALGGHPLQRLDHEPDDRPADQQQERVAVVGLGDVLADREVGDARSRPRRPGRRPSASGSPTRAARPSPRTPGRCAESPSPLSTGETRTSADRDREVGDQQQRAPPARGRRRPRSRTPVHAAITTQADHAARPGARSCRGGRR